MTEKYRVGELNSTGQDDPVIETWAAAMDWAEAYAGQFDEQVFLGIWLAESGGLMGIFDGIDWFTK